MSARNYAARITVYLCNDARRAQEWLEARIEELGVDAARNLGLFYLAAGNSVDLARLQERIAGACDPWFDTSALERSQA